MASNTRRNTRQYDDYDEYDNDDTFEDLVEESIAFEPLRPARKPGKPKRSERARPAAVLDLDDEPDDDETNEALERKAREKRRVVISESFKCRNCKAFIGEPPTGGQQRNHCPMCLHSLHVDDKTPGDRASECRSLMEPIGVFYRRNLEQVVVHRCLGCGFTRYNRIASDDNEIMLGELPIVDPPETSSASDEDDRETGNGKRA
ncbi:MAG: RNHCP domain-containing protein [Thermomicrobiales bacterium]